MTAWRVLIRLRRLACDTGCGWGDVFRRFDSTMGVKKAKTAQKAGVADKPVCPECGADVRVVKFAGAGKRGMFWVCDKACGYEKRTK